MSRRTLTYGDTVDSVSTDAPGTMGTSVWARPGADMQTRGAAAIAPGPPAGVGAARMGAPPVPVLPPPTAQWGSVRGGRSRLIWVILWGAALLSITAIVLTAMKWSSPAGQPVTPPATAAGPPAYTSEQIAAAKKDACDASMTTDAPITQAHNALWATRRDSPEWAAALANYQVVMLVETEYLKSMTRPEAPAAVRAAVSNAVDAQLAEVAAVTAGTPVSAKVDAVKAAGAQLEQVCK